jgi:FAD synthetase
MLRSSQSAAARNIWTVQYFLLLLLVSPFRTACEAFHPNSQQSSHHSMLWGTMTENSMTRQEQSTTIPNWRLLPKRADDYRSHLMDRSPWSEQQYKDSLQLYEDLMSCTDSYISPAIQMALNTLDHAYRLYGPNSVICSFNGGKDAVVILHLLRAAHAKHYNTTGEIPIRPRAVYFNHEDEFPQVVSFLQESVETFDLDMIAFENGVGFSEGLKVLVQHNFLPGSTNVFPMAFVLGTRSSDPNAVGQDHFSPSSHWMPPFMRVNPILHWNYGLVWHFLRLFQLPYCGLYDEGYTSLGTVKDTYPCPALAVNRGDNREATESNSSLPMFWPAYMLRDWDQERAGRLKKDKNGENAKKNSVPMSPKPLTRSASGLTTVSNIRLLDVNNGSAQISENTTEADVYTVQSLGSDECNNGAAKTVGILIVGDEILKGMTMDTNTNVAAKALRKECVQLGRVAVVSDDVDAIANEICRMRAECDVIITSGGVGPTHDDVTIKGVAQALDRELVLHEEMADLLREKMGSSAENEREMEDLTPAQVKMATLPSNAKLRYLAKDDWPVLQCRNVFILPGVPEFFAKKIENVAHYLSSQLERSVAYKVVLSVDEPSIVDILNDAVKKHPMVSFGSYPFVSHPEFKTVLTLEGNMVDPSSHVPSSDESSSVTPDNFGTRNSALFDRDAFILPKEVRDRNVRIALDDLLRSLPKGSILRVENEDLDPFS